MLTNVINKLAEGNSRHIPFRDSKLTRIIQQSLCGNSLTTIVCCISPAICNFNQTLSTLRFAQRAKNIQLSPEINQIEDGSESVRRKLEQDLSAAVKQNQEFRSENKQLNEKITSLTSQIEQMTREMCSIEERLEKDRANFAGSNRSSFENLAPNPSNHNTHQSQTQQEEGFIESFIARLTPCLVKGIGKQQNREAVLQHIQDNLQFISQSYK